MNKIKISEKGEQKAGRKIHGTFNNPFSKDIDELLEKRADVQEKDTEDGLTYEESMKKIEERIKELGILEEEE